MTTITAELQIETVKELIERQRVARMIAIGSASFSGLIGLVAGILAVTA
jgi:hypothetical protein